MVGGEKLSMKTNKKRDGEENEEEEKKRSANTKGKHMYHLGIQESPQIS